MKRILIISEFNMIKRFVLPVVQRLKEEAEVLQFDCFMTKKLLPENNIELKAIFNNVYFNKYPSGVFSRLPGIRFLQYIMGLRITGRELPCYDVAHINFHHYFYAFFTKIIRKKTKKLCVTFYGSDFNNVAWYRHICNRKTIALTDQLFATNPTMLDMIIEKYNLINSDKRTGILMPLMKTFISFGDFLLKHNKHQSRNEWSTYQKLITCGYNADSISRHEEIIKVLIENKKLLKDCFIVFPMTYGQKVSARRTKVKSLLKNSDLHYLVIEDYLKIEKIMALRLATDIFIHIQSRDQMSSSMLEHLAAGSVVITGKWLPYDSLERLGIYLIRINKIDDLKEALFKVILDLEKHLELCKKNREIILNLMSWENIKYSWYEAYSLQ
ncbi:MAG: hypothetical protein JW723_07905 [Bacteroidales bacterium]|nr:hypothetical protein [Bacteroidales bacterium]